MKPSKTRKVKIVKAWAVLENNKLVYDIYVRPRPLKDEIERPWVFPYNRQAVKLKKRLFNSPLVVVPCMITFTLPKN